MSVEAAVELRALMHNEKTPKRVRAEICKYIIDRRLGRPTQSGVVDHQLTLAPPARPSGEDILARLGLLRRPAALPGASPIVEVAGAESDEVPRG